MSRSLGTAARFCSIRAGSSFPLGATLTADGVNFSLFSRNALKVELLLFDDERSKQPSIVIDVGAQGGRTYHYWHVFVCGLRAGQIYGYRVSGPSDPTIGLRFDPAQVLLDPYGKGVVIPAEYRRTACPTAWNCATAMKSVVVDTDSYDWEGDLPLQHSCARTTIYEMHVRGMTQHKSSGVADHLRGTYAGVIEKIPYLVDLGITAVELLPVFQFDSQDCPAGLTNYWGYAPISFFAPHRAYSSDQTLQGPVNEFRNMVKALHRASIEVILDVVFNHTAEGSEAGPTLSFKGIDNPTYYILEKDRSRYANYSGTGNTLNANHPIVRRMIVDCLCYWAGEMHVDGFRFDLASILSRDADGQPLANPPVLWDIESHPMLAGTKFIAEAWDAAGLYQVGSFVGDSWREWNGRFRDDVRDFFRCERGTVRRFADRILGSPQIYEHEMREPEQTVNFVTCHDGFTLNDLVSYQRKHNEPNGEGNLDGTDDNRSCNWGVEGPSTDETLEHTRNRLVKNFLATTVLSLGVPMILMGDEVRRTQQGNNNAYCQDNEVSWFDWSYLQKYADVHRFVKLLLQWRANRYITPTRDRRSLHDVLSGAAKAWHGIRLNDPDWSDHSHSLALTIEVAEQRLAAHLIFNAYWESLRFELPALKGAVPWRRWIDTALDPPNEIVEWDLSPRIDSNYYEAGARSTVVLLAWEPELCGQ